MSLPTPNQSVSHKQFHQCVNHKKKLSLRHFLPTFGSFSFFQATIWLGVDKELQKLTKSYKSGHRHLFQCCILIPRKCLCKTTFQHTVPRPPTSAYVIYEWYLILLFFFINHSPIDYFFAYVFLYFKKIKYICRLIA